MKIYWDNDNAMKDFIYTNYSLSLGHKSCIDHIIMSGCIFDGIRRNNVIYDGDNPSNHNLLFLAVKSLSNMAHVRSINSKPTNRVLCSWNKATATDIELYKHCIDTKLDSITCFYNDVVYCTDINCCIPSHKRQINEMCSTLINLCILASAQTIPQGRLGDKAIPGWNEQVKSYKETSLFWHWIWLEDVAHRK